MKIKFNLNNFEPVPEGERTLQITEAKCVPSGKPSKMEVTFKDVMTNRTIKSTYNFTSNGALMAMGFLLRIALKMENADEFDTDDASKLVNKVLKCEVIHTNGTTAREDGTFPVFANISKVLELVNDNEVTIPEKSASSVRNAIATDDLD